MANLVDGILAQRDRLQKIKEQAGEIWETPEFYFYRTLWQNLYDRATDAIGGKTDVVSMIALYKEMEEFES